MYYAANMIFGKSENGSINQGFIVVFSLFWGLAIFSIDWGLVKTMRKSKVERHFLRELVTPAVLFRIAVAVIISFSISRPLEVAIYEKRLKLQIVEDRDKRLENKSKEIENKHNQIYKKPINKATNLAESIARQKAKGPTSLTYKINSKEYEKCDDELKGLTSVNLGKINQLNIEINNISNSPAYKDAINKFLTKDAKNLISQKNSTIARLRNQIARKRNDCQLIQNKLENERASFESSFSSLETDNAIELATLREGLKNESKIDSLDEAKIKKEAIISLDPENPGLITSLEALANFEESEEGGKVKIIRLILLLIFILIDTAPIMVKILTKRGPYEELQEAEEEKMRYLATAEKNANMLLISNIATAQNRILRQAVNRYEKEELDRILKEQKRYQEFVPTDPSNSTDRSNPTDQSNSANSPNTDEA
jgi:uncharacterized membrane protein